MSLDNAATIITLQDSFHKLLIHKVKVQTIIINNYVYTTLANKQWLLHFGIFVVNPFIRLV